MQGEPIGPSPEEMGLKPEDLTITPPQPEKEKQTVEEFARGNNRQFEEYSQKDVLADGRIVEIKSATLGSKLKNEDTFLVKFDAPHLVLGVFDGRSSLKAIKGLEKTGQTGAYFASHLVRDYIDALPADTLPGQALTQANNYLRAESRKVKGVDEGDKDTWPATGATYVTVDFDTNYLRYAHIADATLLVVDKDGRIEKLTANLNERFDAETFRMIEELAKKKGITNRQAAEDPQIRESLLESFRKKDNALSDSVDIIGRVRKILDGIEEFEDFTGIGILNGDRNLAFYLLDMDQIPLEGISEIVLLSDGAIPPGWDINSESDQKRIVQTLREGDPEALLKRKIESEESDPEWNITRTKQSDDATVVYASIK